MDTAECTVKRVGDAANFEINCGWQTAENMDPAEICTDEASEHDRKLGQEV